MKILCAVLLTITVVSTALAKEVFTDKDRKDIRVLEIRDGKAIVETGDKARTEVEVGDRIGKDRGKVVKVGKGAVVVEHGNTRIRMRVYPGVVREENAPR